MLAEAPKNRRLTSDGDRSSLHCSERYLLGYVQHAMDHRGGYSDGLHPNAGGMTKIYNEVEARL